MVWFYQKDHKNLNSSFGKLVLEDFARAKFRGTKQQIRTLHFAKLELLDQKRTSYLSEVVLIKLKIGHL